MRNPCALLLLCAAACTSKGSEAAARTVDTIAQRDSVAGIAAATMKEDHVIGLLERTHAADSAIGMLAALRGSAPEVKEFGRMIVREHQALKKEAVAVAHGLNFAPSAPPVPPDSPPVEMLAHLQAAPPGLTWDQAYLEYAIAVHRSAMENSARALAATKSPETRRFIQRSVPILQKHLDKASSLHQTLSKAQEAPAPKPTP
jgi:predicted outer membrane protein